MRASACLFSSITSSQTRSTQVASLLVQRSTAPGPCRDVAPRDDADPADPCIRPAQTELREADRRTVAERDPGRLAVEVERLRQERSVAASTAKGTK